jgi:hypothetical protein
MKPVIGALALVFVSVACGAAAVKRTSSAPSQQACAWPESLDAPAAAPENHRILFENDRVRMLDVVVPVGGREPVHAHCWPSVLYVLFRGKLRERDATGKVIREVAETPPPSAFPMTQWLPVSPPHSIENLDSQPIHLLRIELKQ